MSSMAPVRLKVNMIVDGVNYAVDSVVDREWLNKLPKHLRVRENYEVVQEGQAEALPPTEEFAPPGQEEEFAQ
jgi:hypothetical protein